MIAEFFEELNEEMNRTYNPKSWRRQDALMSFAGSSQQEMGGDITEAPDGLIVESNSHQPTDVLHNPALELITSMSSTNINTSSTLPDADTERLDTSLSIDKDLGRDEYKLCCTVESNTLYLLGPEMESCFPHECSGINTLESDNEDSGDKSGDDESNLLEIFSKFKDDEVTTTTADESWDESGSITSEFESVIDTQPSCVANNTGPIIGGQETRKEKERRLLRQNRESYRGPKEMKKHFRRSNHPSRLDVIHENVGE